MRSIAVFCGSSSGNDPAYKETAVKLGKYMASKNIRLIYGGASIGLMGTLADSVLNSGGQATGVLPDFLRSKEIKHEGLSEIITVVSMHDRKKVMYDKAEGIMILPGGLGTLDELFEVLTWSQLGLHSKPIGLLNTLGYYDSLLNFLDEIRDKRFIKSENRNLLLSEESIPKLVNSMIAYQPDPVSKWIKDDEI